MNAMIFAAGLGTRLRPLTDHCPKALVTVEGKSLLEHNIIKLRRAGFDHIVVNVHHFGQQIIDFINQNHIFGIDIKVSDERQQLLDTGGGIMKALSLFDNADPVLIHNVDIISSVDLSDVYQHHLAHGADATLCVAHRPTSRYLLFDDDMLLRGWTNITTGEVKGTQAPNMMAFAGIHVVSQSIAATLGSMGSEAFPIMDYYLTHCSHLTFSGYQLPTDTLWVDCGKPESLVKASEILKKLC